VATASFGTKSHSPSALPSDFAFHISESLLQNYLIQTNTYDFNYDKKAKKQKKRILALQHNYE
jgi:hypothetical protein